MANPPSIPEGFVSGVTTTGKIMKDIKSITAQGRGTSNGNFGMTLSIGVMNRGSKGFVRKTLYTVKNKDLIRFDVTRDFLSSFTDYMVVEFQIPAKLFRDVIVKNKSSLMGFLRFGILDHNIHGRGSSGKYLDESVNYWRLSAYVLQTEGFNALDPYADNVKNDDLDKIGLVKCKLQLVFPEYEILNSWCVGITLKNADMYNVVAIMLARFQKEREPKIFGKPMELNYRIEHPDNTTPQENVVTTDFILDPTEKDAKVPTLLNMIYNVHEMYGMYVSGMCLYVYRELSGHRKSFKTIKENTDLDNFDQQAYEKQNEEDEKNVKETSLAICRGIRPVPVPLPYPVDYVDANNKGVIGEPLNVNVMYDKVKALGGKMVRIFICPPEPQVALTENTFGCLANDFDASGKERKKQSNLAGYSLDIISTTNPQIVNPTHEFIGTFADEAYFPSKGNYNRQTNNSENNGIRTHTKGNDKAKINISTQEIFAEADKANEEERKKIQEKADAKKKEEYDKMNWLEKRGADIVNAYNDSAEYVEGLVKDGLNGVVTAAAQALSSFWGVIQKFFTNANANQFRETSLNYMLSTVKMNIEWRHSNPWLINPNDLTEVLMEDNRGLFHYLGSVTSIAWTYDFNRQSANSKIQFMGKLSHITPPKYIPKPVKKEGKDSNTNSTQAAPAATTSADANKKSTTNTKSMSRRVPYIPSAED